MQDLVTLDLWQHNEKLRNSIDVSPQESFLFMIRCSKHSQMVLEAVQLKWRLSEVALFISCLFYLNTGSRDWYMMPGGKGEQREFSCHRDPRYNLKKAPFYSFLPASLSLTLPLLILSHTVSHPHLPPGLSRFKTCLQMQRKPSILSVWQDPPLTCSWDCEKLTYTTASVKYFLGCCSCTRRLFF